MEEKIKQYIELLAIDIKDHYNSTLWKGHALKNFYSIVGQIEPIVSDDFGGQYSQGICDDGAVILYDGKPMTPELIVAQLNELSEIKKRLYYKVIVSQNSR